MKEEENRRRVEEGLATGLTKEVSENEKNERRFLFFIRFYFVVVFVGSIRIVVASSSSSCCYWGERGRESS